MAIAFVQATAQVSGSSVNGVTTNAFGASTVSGNMIVGVLAKYFNGDTGTISISDTKSNNYTTVLQKSQSPAHAIQGYGPVVTGGTSHQVIFNNAGFVGWFEGNAIEFSGQATTSPVDVSAFHTSNAAGDPSTTTANMSQADGLLVAVAGINCGGSGNISNPPTVNGSTTNVATTGINNDGNATVGYESCYKVLTVQSTQAVAWTSDGTESVGLIVVYKAAAGGGGGGPVLQPFMIGDLSGIGSPGRFLKDPLQRVMQLVDFYKAQPA